MTTDRGVTPARWRCKDCGAVNTETHMLTAASPFDPTALIIGCPECLAISNFELMCDHAACRRPATSGMPTLDGYRRTCYEHRPERS